MGTLFLIFLNAKLYKTRKARQILILRQNSVCFGLRFLSESKLFGKRRSHVCAASATLIGTYLASLALCIAMSYSSLLSRAQGKVFFQYQAGVGY